MRAIWKGSLSFGLVNVPVKLYSRDRRSRPAAAPGARRRRRPHPVSAQLRARRQGRRRTSTSRRPTTTATRRVILTDDDFAALPERAQPRDRGRRVRAERAGRPDHVRAGSYYLAPDSKSTKAYVLLRRTLEESDRTAIVQFALRQRTRLAALRVRDDVLVLQTLLWDDEVREARFPELDEAPRISPASSRCRSSSSRASSPTSARRSSPTTTRCSSASSSTRSWRRATAIDAEETFGREEEAGGEVLDLMEALRRSVDRQRGESAAGAGRSRRPSAPAKKPRRRRRRRTSSGEGRGGGEARPDHRQEVRAALARARLAVSPALRNRGSSVSRFLR